MDRSQDPAQADGSGPEPDEHVPEARAEVAPESAPARAGAQDTPPEPQPEPAEEPRPTPEVPPSDTLAEGGSEPRGAGAGESGQERPEPASTVDPQDGAESPESEPSPAPGPREPSGGAAQGPPAAVRSPEAPPSGTPSAAPPGTPVTQPPRPGPVPGPAPGSAPGQAPAPASGPVPGHPAPPGAPHSGSPHMPSPPAGHQAAHGAPPGPPPPGGPQGPPSGPSAEPPSPVAGEPRANRGCAVAAVTAIAATALALLVGGVWAVVALVTMDKGFERLPECAAAEGEALDELVPGFEAGIDEAIDGLPDERREGVQCRWETTADSPHTPAAARVVLVRAEADAQSSGDEGAAGLLEGASERRDRTALSGMGDEAYSWFEPDSEPLGWGCVGTRTANLYAETCYTTSGDFAGTESVSEADLVDGAKRLAKELQAELDAQREG